MLNFIVCEDNKETLERISTIINKIMMPYNFDYKIHKFQKYNSKLEELIKDTTSQKIYILDIIMTEVSGLEIASEIRNIDWDSSIIFLTAHKEYRDDIFYSRLLAIDYIPKNTLSTERLTETIKIILNKVSGNKVLNFKYNSTTYRIPYDNIVYIEKVPKYKKCLIMTEDREPQEISGNLNNLLSILGKDFYLSHKSCIVNVTKIKEIDETENIITFKNGEQTVLLSNRQRKGLKEYVSNY